MSTRTTSVSASFLSKLRTSLFLSSHAGKLILEAPDQDLKDPRAQISACLDDLRKLQQKSESVKQFDQYLSRDLGCTRNQVRITKAALKNQDQYVAGVLGKMANAKSTSTAELSTIMDDYLSSEDARKDLGRKVTIAIDQEDSKHLLYPFFEALKSTSLSVAVRAEILAQIDVYIRSGHAAMDFSGETASGRAPNLAEKESVQNLMTWMSDVRQGKMVASDKTMTQLFMSRLSHLYIPVEVINRKMKNDEILPIAQFSQRTTACLNIQGSGRTAAARMVDGVIRDAGDHHRLHVVFATSQVDSASQKDQMARHCSAIHRATLVGSEDDTDETFQQGDSIEAIHFYSPGILGVAGEQKHSSKQIEKIANVCNDTQRKAINSLPLLAMLGARMDVDTSSTDFILQARHRTIGGNSSFSTSQLNTSRIDDLAEDAARALKVSISALHEMIRKTSLKSVLASEGIHTLCKSIELTSRGLFANYPEACVKVLTERDFKLPLDECIEVFESFGLQGPEIALQSAKNFLQLTQRKADDKKTARAKSNYQKTLSREEKLLQTRVQDRTFQKNLEIVKGYIKKVKPGKGLEGQIGDIELYGQEDLYLGLARWCPTPVIRALNPDCGITPKDMLNLTVPNENGESVSFFEADEKIQKTWGLAILSQQKNQQINSESGKSSKKSPGKK